MLRLLREVWGWPHPAEVIIGKGNSFDVDICLHHNTVFALCDEVEDV